MEVNGVTEAPEHIGGGAPPIFSSSIKKREGPAPNKRKNGWTFGVKMGDTGWVRHGGTIPSKIVQFHWGGAPPNETTPPNFRPKTL